MTRTMTRRDLFRLAGLGVALLPVLAACGGPPASPASKTSEAPAPTTAAAPAAATKPATTTEPTAAPKTGSAPVTVRYMERAGALGEFMRYWSRQYEERNRGVVIKNEGASWGDLSTKVQTYVAAGTMADVAFQHGQLMLPELAAKGVWLDLEPLGNTEKHDWKIYYKWAIDSLRIGPDNKLVALPMGIHSGQNQLLWNKELLQKAGVKEPNPEMTVDDLTRLALDLKRALPDIWPIMSGIGHWDMEAHSRSWKGYLISQDRKQNGLELEATQEAHRFIHDWVNRHKIQPGRQEIQGNQAQMFWSGKLAIAVNCAPNIYVGFNEAVAGKFTLGTVMWPSKPSGVVGTVPSADANVIYGKTKVAEHAWGLVKLISSAEASTWTAVNAPNMTPGAIVTSWHDPAVWKAAPPYQTLALFLDDLDKRNITIGSIPVPANTRRAEYDDLYNNEWAAMVYGEKPFDKDSIAALNKKLQAIMDKPLP